MLGKRGEGAESEVIFLVFELVIVVLFIASVFIMLNQALSDQTYYERYLARDIALTIDAMHAAPGSFELDYFYSTPKESELDFRITQGVVSILPASERSNAQPLAATFLFGFTNLNINSKMEYQGTDKLSRTFKIIKDDNKILLEEKK